MREVIDDLAALVCVCVCVSALEGEKWFKNSRALTPLNGHVVLDVGVRVGS